MRTLVSLLLITLPVFAQLEATAPGVGRLFTDTLLYKGKHLESGMAKAAAIEALGQTKTVSKAQRMSSTKLASQMGLLIPAFADRITLKCGVCWLEIVEKSLAKNEAIRVVMMGPSPSELKVALIVLEKTCNQYAKTLDDIWEGFRNIYLGEVAFRLNQDHTGISVEPLDTRTGQPIQPSPETPAPSPGELKRRLRSFTA